MLRISAICFVGAMVLSAIMWEVPLPSDLGVSAPVRGLPVSSLRGPVLTVSRIPMVVLSDRAPRPRLQALRIFATPGPHAFCSATLASAFLGLGVLWGTVAVFLSRRDARSPSLWASCAAAATTDPRHKVHRLNNVLEASAVALQRRLSGEGRHCVEVQTKHVSKKGAEALARVLVESPTVSSLTVTTEEYVGAEGLSPGTTALLQNAVPRALPSTTALRDLTLRLPFLANDVALRLAGALPHSAVQTLSIQTSWLLKDALRSLGDVVRSSPNLRRLELTAAKGNVLVPQEAKDFLRAVQESPTLKELALHLHEVSADFATGLAAVLRANRHLDMLDLTGTDPKVDGLTAIVTALRDNHGLQTLMLRGIQVKPEVVGALADALQGNATLRTLDLQQVGTTDAEAFALAAAFAAHPSLTSLNLAEADLTDAGISALADAVRRNTSIVALDVLHNRTTDEGMAALAAAVTASTLRDLSAGASSVTAVGLQSMAEILADNPSLTALRLAALDIKDEGTVALAESLRRNTVVRTLALRNLGWYRTTGQRVWGDVAPDPGIRTRSIVEPAFTEWHTNEIEKTKKDWRAEKQALVDQQAASHRRRIRSGPPLTSKRLTALKNRLTMLKTDKTANTRRAQMAPLLAKLDFGVKRQRDTGPIALAETLKENGTITALELHNYQITTAAARALREMLARNTALTSLDLADNYIDREAIVELLPALRSNSTLTHLGLRHNLLRDPGAQAIAATLQRNTALRSMDLRDNLLTDKSCVSLATAVAAHPGVVLDLRDNFIPTTVWQDPTVRSLLSEARLFMDEDD